jgi:hypothetical protein
MPLLPPEGGARPQDDVPSDLRVPTSPQREHFIDIASALGRYIEAGGGLLIFTSRRSGDQLTITFAVDRQTYGQTEAEVRRERTGNGPWVWTPKRGLRRRR